MRRLMNFLAGAMCGALVGAVTALLMAPTSGEILQQRLKDRTTSLREEIREAYEARMTQLEAELESLRSPRKSAEE
jgi:gas vesicle protein